MASSVNRFAITALSRDNKGFAVNEEILVHKETGQMLIKTPSGSDIISFDSLSRAQAHIDTVTRLAKLAGMDGDMYFLTIGNIELPEVVPENTNLLDNELLLKSNPVTGCLISIDMDMLGLSDSDVIASAEPLVTLQLSFRRTIEGGDVEKTPITLTRSLSESNSFQIRPQDLLDVSITDYTPYSLFLESLIIARNGSFIAPEVILKNIVYSIIVVRV